MINSHFIFKRIWPMFSIRLIIFAFISLSIMPGYISAVEVQEKTSALVIGQAIKIDSKILNEERPIWIYLPEDYKTSKYKKYPVLYMLDGAYHFHHITGAVQMLVKAKRIPQIIIIGIPYI
ncbi:MAG: alpha/beta hydrolase-fold protein, partial [Desulfobacteraceae bacterium]